MIDTRDEQVWLSEIRAQVSCGDVQHAQVMLTKALNDYPTSIELRRLQAGLFQQAGRSAEAEAIFHKLLAQSPGDTTSAFSLARTLKEQGRVAKLASVLRDCLAHETNRGDANLAIAGIEFLDDCERERDAAAIAQAAIADIPDDPRLHAYAGMLEIQLGDFEQARQHYLFALHDARAWEWHVPIGLSSAQRYTTHDHPDFALFSTGLQRDDLSDKARAELHFAAGKARDDIGEYEVAARHFREGNSIAHRLTKWSRKSWRRAVEARLSTQSVGHPPEHSDDFMPVFIVGMPRSGTTLLAELLSRFPKTCNRGELPWIALLAQRPELVGNPDLAALARAAAIYASQSRRDDAEEARWFIDKQPLNFRYLDLMLAMFPHAKIVHCQRSPRDTASSLWMQCFREEVQGYAYDFADIALVMRDEEKLMSHWRELYPQSIYVVRYEDVVTAAEETINALGAWIGLPAHGPIALDPLSGGARTISTASLWQARQPINVRSIGRWKHYVPHVSELLRFSE